MEKWKVTIVVTALVIFISSCHHGRGERVIVENNGSHHVRIEYSGRITFSEDSTAIARMSRNGYLKYEENDRKLEAERVGDKIIYRLNDQIETSTLTEHDRQFVSEAVREMMKRGHYRN